MERNKLDSLFGSSGIKISDMCYNCFEKYAEALVERNKLMNLTGITDPQGISEKHFLDSLLIFQHCDISEGSSVIDVGTGAGFPGLPMKIYRSDLDMTLLDSLNKRVVFLKDVCQALKLPVHCIHMRAEDGGRDTGLRESFDTAVARAVAALPVLIEYCLPYVKKGGKFIAMKGPGEDISCGKKAIELLGGKIADIIEYKLPGGDKRIIAVIEKISETPIKYPRNSAQISKNPLL